jgi:hypothetical protein
LANNWRSATFQSINHAIQKPNDPEVSALCPLAKLYVENVTSTCTIILDLLKALTTLSGHPLPPSVEKEVHDIVRLSSEYAMQIGVNPAQLFIGVPLHREIVQIGSEYHDYQNGDSDRGTPATVDLMVAPGVLKVGDGRSDLETRRSIVPCVFYPF